MSPVWDALVTTHEGISERLKGGNDDQATSVDGGVGRAAGYASSRFPVLHRRECKEAGLPVRADHCPDVDMPQMKIVRFPIGGGYWWMRCERHAPAWVQRWLAYPEPPGFIEVEEVMDSEAKQRCVACLAEEISQQ